MHDGGRQWPKFHLRTDPKKDEHFQGLLTTRCHDCATYHVHFSTPIGAVSNFAGQALWSWNSYLTVTLRGPRLAAEPPTLEAQFRAAHGAVTRKTRFKQVLAERSLHGYLFVA